MTMAGTGLLSKCLDLSEVNSIPVDTRSKLERFLALYESQSNDLKTKYERLQVSSEQQYLEIDTQLQGVTNKLQTETSHHESLRTDYSKLEEKYKAAEAKLKSYQEAEDCNVARQLSKTNELLESEKRDLSLLLEKRNKEIENLNDEWKRLSDQLSKSEMDKVQAKVKFSEVQSQFVSIECQSKMLQQKNDQLQKQVDWLNKDLTNKTKELYNTRQEQSSRVLDIQSKLQEKADEVAHLQNSLETLTSTNSDQAKKIENYIQKLEDARYMQIQSEEQFQQELNGRKRLADLYKVSASEAENKVEELTRAVGELRQLLQDAATAYSDLEEDKKVAVEQASMELKERDERIEKLQQELVNANDLIQDARSKVVTEEQVENLFPTAAATSKLIKSGMTLTQIYSEYVQASESLLLEREENKRLNQDLNDIIHEIEQKAPILKKQKEDFEQAVESVEQLSRQLDSAMLECQTNRAEAEQTTRKCNSLQRENHRLQQQTIDLSKQVQYLVKEIEEVKGGRIVHKREISSNDVTSSSHVISEDLVTFGSIEELQEQNKKLMSMLREMNEKKIEDEQLATESKTKDLKSQLDRTLKEMLELKSARERQTEYVKSLVSQRDMYRVLLQQSDREGTDGISTPKASVSAALSPGHKPMKSPGLEKTVEEKTKALQQLQEDFDTYKKEMQENQKILNDQNNKLQNDLSEMRVQNMKISSQLDFSGERYKVLQGNMEGFRKEIGALREKEKKLLTSVAKHEQTINTLRQDSLKIQESAARAEAQCQNLRTEKELLKTAEQRMLQELENSRRTQSSQSMLMANLQAIQNSLERSDFDTRTRYTNQIEKLEVELKSLTRKLESSEEEKKALGKLYENQVKSLRDQMDTELKSHELDKNNLVTARKEIQDLKDQVIALESKLSEMIRKTDRDIQTCRDSGIPVGSFTDSDEVKNLKSELENAKREVLNLKEQCDQSKQHMQQYKDLADNLQQAIGDQAQCTKDMESNLTAAKEDRDHLNQRINELQSQRQELLDENRKVSEESHKLNADLRKQLSKLQVELQESVQKYDEAVSKTNTAVGDCKKQSQLVQEMHDNYQRELMLHAADVEALSTVKKQLEEFNTKYSSELEARVKAEGALGESKQSWEEQEKILKKECERLETRCDDLNKQNQIVHEQMEKMSKEVMSIQQAVTKRPGSFSADTSFSEDNGKSSEQLLEVVKFLRKEKEIAESRLEIIQAECNMFKQRYERQEKSLSEVTKALNEEQIKGQANLQTAAQHTELLRKVENLNLLSDSNKLLREDKEKLEQTVQELEAKVKKFESEINPLQETLREISIQRDAYGDDKEALKGEVERWKSRTNHLIEQANKTDPEEHKKLQQEKERISRELKFSTEDNQKLKQEKERISKELKMSTEDNQKLKAEFAKSNTSLQNAQQETSQVKQQVTALNKTVATMKEEMEKKSNDNEEKNKTIFQLKKIGRKYKEQAENVSKELEDTKTQFESLKESQSRQDQQTSASVLEQHTGPLKEELENAKKECEATKEKLEKQTTEFQAAKEQITQLEQTINQLQSEVQKVKGENTEYEKKQNQSRVVLTAAKKKIAGQTEEVEKLNKEVADLRGKISSNTQQTSEETEIKITSLKLDYENQIEQLEKKLSELQGSSEETIKTMQSSLDKVTQENSDLQSKLLQLQKQLESHSSQTKPVAPQVSRPTTAVAVDRSRVVERNIVSTSESPKMANIKPMSSPATIRPQTSQSQQQMGGARVMASIRPMAIAPTAAQPITISVPTPTATVMPTTIQHETQDLGDNVSQLSPVATARPTQQVQRVIPQVESSADQSSDVTPDSSSQHEVTSSEAQTTTSVPPSSVARTREITPTSTTSGANRDPPQITGQLGKRSREDMESQEEETDAKRSKVTVPQEANAIPSITVTDEHANTTSLQTEGDRNMETAKETESAIAVESEVSLSTDESQLNLAVSDSAASVSSDVTIETTSATMLAETREVVDDTHPYDSASKQIKKQQPDSNAIIILESDEEEYEDDEDEDDDEDYDEEEQEEEYGEEDEEGEKEDQEEFTESQEEMMQAQTVEVDDDIVIEEQEMEGGDQEEFSETQEEMMQAQTQEADEDVVIVEDGNEGTMENQGEDSAILPQVPVATSSNLFTMRPVSGIQPIERQTSITRQLTPFIIGGHTGFEDGEDGIVPSTPTLSVPYRGGDGYAEVVSSPHISNQRFTFGSVADQNQSHLAQLASQGALGMDDTRMDLSQLEEGSGRSVPSTPLRTNAPVSIITEAAVASKLAEQTTSSGVAATEGDIQPETSKSEEEKSEDAVTTESSVTGEESQASTTGDKTDGIEKESEGESSSSQQIDKTLSQTETAEKPKIQPIVWESSSSTTSPNLQTSSQAQPPYRGRQVAVRGSGMVQRGQQQRGRFHRGRSPLPRGRGGLRGNRGGMY